MNKKLLAAAVAGALALPGVALAQVTINGILKVGIDQYSISGNTVRGTKSETRITDNSSRIIIGVSEDLGGGLAAIGQWDIRGAMDSGGAPAGAVATTSQSAIANSGNTWVGLRSNSWGTVTLGRHDLHYGSQPDDIASKAGALMAASISLMDFANGGATAIANATRTPNVVRWDTPNWGGFTGTLAYSTANSALEGDLSASGVATSTTAGSAYNAKAQYTAANWQVGGSLWSAKAEGTGAEQTGQVFFGYIRFGGFKVGAAFNTSDITSAAGVETSKRNAYTVPASFTSGAHNFYAHYTKADADDHALNGGTDTGASMYAFAYVYDLSKRSSVGVTYAKIDNGLNASYNFFTNTGGLGSTNSTMTPGEDGQLIAFTVRHAF